jgi:hypothetical protein
MIKSTFKLTYGSDSLVEAEVDAYIFVSEFLGVPREDAPALVDLELVVEFPEETTPTNKKFSVTAFGTVKRSVHKV